MKFDEWAKSSLSQQTVDILGASLFRHYLLYCRAFYFRAQCAPEKNRGAHFIVFADNPSHAIADKLETILSSVRVYEPETRSIVRIVIAMWEWII